MAVLWILGFFDLGEFSIGQTQCIFLSKVYENNLRWNAKTQISDKVKHNFNCIEKIPYAKFWKVFFANNV